METSVETIPSGTVTSPRGFRAGAACAGIKSRSENDALDLGILFSESLCDAAALLTTNRIKAAPVVLCQERLKSGKARAVVVSSGCANAFTGQQGMADAVETATLVADSLGVPPESVLVASTGVIGHLLPMDRVRAGVRHIALSVEGGHELARAMMTTDTVPKEIAVRVGGDYTVAGIAKGAGMIHPDLATMLVFLTTDASVSPELLKPALRQAADVSFQMISVDGDTSTNDMVLLLANGEAQNRMIMPGTPQAQLFQAALERVCIHLAKSIAGDGEGATRLIAVTVSGAVSLAEARAAARTIVSSSLVKTAIHGNDPNWGRIVAAAGRSAAEVVESKIDLRIGDVWVLRNGNILAFDANAVVDVLKRKEVPVNLELNLGTGKATAWGCDLSADYVAINSHYMT